MAAILAGVVFQLISPSSKLPSNLETGPANIVDNLTLIGATISGRLPEHLHWEGS